LPNRVKILVIGDIIGKGARNAFTCYLPTLKQKYNYDLLTINCENITHGRGMSKKHYELLKNLNVDVMTMGNHVLDNKDIEEYIANSNNLVVPGNVKYSNEVFDNHKVVSVLYKGYTIKFVNLLNVINTKGKYEITDPICYLNDVISSDENAIYVVDYHAEFTLIKNSLAYYFDGKASLVYGTHTHVQTADERILPKGTAYITDVGMCGAIDSVIGYDYNSFVNKINKEGSTCVAENGPFMVNGLLVEIDLDSKVAVNVLRINERI